MKKAMTAADDEKAFAGCLQVYAVRVQCHYCSKFRLAGECLFLSGGVVRCGQCAEKQTAALEEFVRRDLTACDGCWEPIGRESHYFMDWKDGRYALHCAACHVGYVPKRKDLFRATPFAHHEKL